MTVILAVLLAIVFFPSSHAISQNKFKHLMNIGSEPPLNHKREDKPSEHNMLKKNSHNSSNKLVPLVNRAKFLKFEKKKAENLIKKPNLNREKDKQTVAPSNSWHMDKEKENKVFKSAKRPIKKDSRHLSKGFNKREKQKGGNITHPALTGILKKNSSEKSTKVNLQPLKMTATNSHRVPTALNIVPKNSSGAKGTTVLHTRKISTSNLQKHRGLEATRSSKKSNKNDPTYRNPSRVTVEVVGANVKNGTVVDLSLGFHFKKGNPTSAHEFHGRIAREFANQTEKSTTNSSLFHSRIHKTVSNSSLSAVSPAKVQASVSQQIQKKVLAKSQTQTSQPLAPTSMYDDEYNYDSVDGSAFDSEVDGNEPVDETELPIIGTMLKKINEEMTLHFKAIEKKLDVVPESTTNTSNVIPVFEQTQLEINTANGTSSSNGTHAQCDGFWSFYYCKYFKDWVDRHSFVTGFLLGFVVPLLTALIVWIFYQCSKDPFANGYSPVPNEDPTETPQNRDLYAFQQYVANSTSFNDESNDSSDPLPPELKPAKSKCKFV